MKIYFQRKVKTASFQHENWRFWSEWRDSNSRHPGPKPGALPTGPHPDIKLREKARCGQICGQRNSTTFLPNFQRRLYGVIAKLKGSMQHLEQSNRFGVPAPKSSALPTGPHPDYMDDIIHYDTEKINQIIVFAWKEIEQARAAFMGSFSF